MIDHQSVVKISMEKKKKKLPVSLLSWRSRVSCPTHWNKDNSEWISKGIETKDNCSLQNLVPGKTAIRGASHGVPFSQPKRSIVLFKLFNAFLEGKQLPQAL
ncbi:hypothetical protein POTOM_051319 [Populus tomentosa]|uniref:Uncharacterized protein n=1 Tax=Populus tomentosa TaxID=118781 RepID=A0A8X8C895_POPTO|nr:hypothetical protein POTOM_051319 [Populus tomentosa]